MNVKVLFCISSLPVIDKVKDRLSFNLKHAGGSKINILSLGMYAIFFGMIPLAFVMIRP